MDTELNRENIIQDLMNFSKETKETLNCILDGIEWNENTVQEPLMVCPFDSNHRMLLDSLEDHLDRCQWKAEGYAEGTLPLSVPSVPPDAPSCIKFDEDLLKNVLQLGKLQQSGEDNRLVPRTSDRFLADFTPEERKIIYDYVIGNTVQFEIGDEIADLNKPQNEDGDGKKVSYLDLVAQERNLKRRRAKHRGVHTNKKSHLEVMREVINHQMDMLAEYIAEKNPQQETPKIQEAVMNRNGTDRLKEHVSRDKTEHKNHRRDYSEENERRHESRRERDDHRDVERRDKSRHSKKSSRDCDRYEERHRRDHKEKNYHSSRERHHSRDRDHQHHHKRSKAKDHDRSRSRRDDDESRKRRRYRD